MGKGWKEIWLCKDCAIVSNVKLFFCYSCNIACGKTPKSIGTLVPHILSGSQRD